MINSKIFIPGPIGKLETIVYPSNQTSNYKGIAVLLHPNPIQGGTNTNKVVITMAKALSKLGYICYLPNLRGVGLSDGNHDFAVGEVDDVLSIIDYAYQVNDKNLPLIIGGFSFGGYLTTLVSSKVKYQNLILIAPAVYKYDMPALEVSIPSNTLIIHGNKDEVVPLDDVFKWGELQDIPITVVCGATHFFHKKLLILEQIMYRYISNF